MSFNSVLYKLYCSIDFFKYSYSSMLNKLFILLQSSPLTYLSKDTLLIFDAICISIFVEIYFLISLHSDAISPISTLERFLIISLSFFIFLNIFST